MISRTLLSFVTAVSVVLSLNACGIGQGNDEFTAQQQQDSKVLTDRFNTVVGLYEGTFTSSNPDVAPQKGILKLFIANVRESTPNPDGTVRVRPALNGRFRLEKVVVPTDYLSMNGDYDKLGNVNMSSLTSAGGTGGAGGGGTGEMRQISILGTIANNSATIGITNDSGYWGRFVGQRVSTEGASPGNDDEEYRERLLSIYREMEGSYQGVVDNGEERVKIEITLTIAEDGKGGSGISVPFLVGQYRRMDFPSGIGERQLAVNFLSYTSRISMNAVQGGGTVPGSQYFAATGTWKDQKLNVTLRDRRGYAGELIAVRKPLRD